MNRLKQWARWAVAAMVSLAASVVGAQAPAQPEALAYVRAHYTKYEFRIAMRDGKRLFTSVYVPKDTSKPYPFLMTRTPYTVGPYGEDNYRARLGPSETFDKAGYIFVFQDVRGRYMSEGAFVEMRPHIDHPQSNQDVDESTDTYDTVEWLLKNVPNNNGKVGIWGISYPGFYTSASIIDSHPAIKAASPEAPMTDPLQQRVWRRAELAWGWPERTEPAEPAERPADSRFARGRARQGEPDSPRAAPARGRSEEVVWPQKQWRRDLPELTAPVAQLAVEPPG